MLSFPAFAIYGFRFCLLMDHRFDHQAMCCRKPTYHRTNSWQFDSDQVADSYRAIDSGQMNFHLRSEPVKDSPVRFLSKGRWCCAKLDRSDFPRLSPEPLSRLDLKLDLRPPWGPFDRHRQTDSLYQTGWFHLVGWCCPTDWCCPVMSVRRCSWPVLRFSSAGSVDRQAGFYPA